MLKKIQLRKSIFSTWAIFIFTIVLGVGATISELYQAPKTALPELHKLTLLFSENELMNINRLNLTNRLGTFEVKKENSRWVITSPRQLPAKGSSIKDIIKSLTDIKIKKMFLTDPINVSNFSLNHPQMTLEIFNSDNKKNTLTLGLVNPIDNSAYVMVSEKDTIYNVDNQLTNLETLNFSNIINPKIFTLSSNDVKKITLFRGKQKRNIKRLHLIKDDSGNWANKKGKQLISEKVNSYLNKLTSLKGLMILDERTEEMEKIINKYISSPIYTIKIVKLDGSEVDYKISSLIKHLPNVKIEKRQSFIMTSSDRKHPYLIARDAIKLFEITERRLKNISLKKLFY